MHIDRHGRRDRAVLSDEAPDEAFFQVPQSRIDGGMGDGDVSAYLAEIDLEESAAAEVPTGMPVQVRLADAKP